MRDWRSISSLATRLATAISAAHVTFAVSVTDAVADLVLLDHLIVGDRRYVSFRETGAQGGRSSGGPPLMSPNRAITSGDSRARLRLVQPLRFAPTPRGAHGHDEAVGAPRDGTYVMARALRQREASGTQRHRRARPSSMANAATSPCFAPWTTPVIQPPFGQRNGDVERRTTHGRCPYPD